MLSLALWDGSKLRHHGWVGSGLKFKSHFHLADNQDETFLSLGEVLEIKQKDDVIPSKSTVHLAQNAMHWSKGQTSMIKQRWKEIQRTQSKGFKRKEGRCHNQNKVWGCKRLGDWLSEWERLKQGSNVSWFIGINPEKHIIIIKSRKCFKRKLHKIWKKLGGGGGGVSYR